MKHLTLTSLLILSILTFSSSGSLAAARKDVGQKSNMLQMSKSESNHSSKEFSKQEIKWQQKLERKKARFEKKLKKLEERFAQWSTRSYLFLALGWC